MRTVAIALMISVFFFVYHTQVVHKMYLDMHDEIARQQIYVYDHEAFVARTRDQAKTLILQGNAIDPEDFYDHQEKLLRAKLAALPPESIVVRSDAVIQGGREFSLE